MTPDEHLLPDAKQCAFLVQGRGRCSEIGAWMTPGITDATIAAARWCGEHRHGYDVAVARSAETADEDVG